MFNLVSLDGFFAGEDGSIDWHMVDDEFNDFAVEQTRSFGTIIFGRVTYKMFEDFWPRAMNDPKMSKEDHEIARIINTIDKIVFSQTLKHVTWKNTKHFKEISVEEIKKMKQQSGKDMVIFGSGTIVQEFTRLGLIDEYRLLVNPIVLGKGKPLFKNMKERVKLKLVNSRTFGNGNVLLSYQKD
jgi:dihydrofolate reductase